MERILNCSRCGESMTAGCTHRKYCDVCKPIVISERATKWQKENPDKFKALVKAYYEKHKTRLYPQHLKKQRERLGIPIVCGETRVCIHCSHKFIMPNNYNHRKYCDTCRKEQHRYGYPFLSDESKEKSKERSIQWRKNNPEKTKAIQTKAMAKYLLKNKDKDGR
jgi:hypothetical protein